MTPSRGLLLLALLLSADATAVELPCNGRDDDGDGRVDPGGGCPCLLGQDIADHFVVGTLAGSAWLDPDLWVFAQGAIGSVRMRLDPLGQSSTVGVWTQQPEALSSLSVSGDGASGLATWIDARTGSDTLWVAPLQDTVAIPWAQPIPGLPLGSLIQARPGGAALAVRVQSASQHLVWAFCDSEGRPAHTPVDTLLDSSDWTSMAVSQEDGDLLLAWTTSAGGLLAARFDPFGVLLGNPVLLVPSGAMAPVWLPRAGATWLFWRSSEQVFLASLDPGMSGPVQSISPATEGPIVGGPAVAPGLDGGAWVAYVDAAPAQQRLALLQVDAFGSPFPISVTQQRANPDGPVSLVWTGAGLSMSWQEGGAVGNNIWRCDCNDADGDGVGACWGDCDDNSASTAPGFPQLCDGVLDNDCDGVPDANEIDADGDGYSPCGPDGIAASGDEDCDDSLSTVYPGASERCANGVDDDCDGTIDEFGEDQDLDSFDNCVDCDDGDSATYPGAPELCDGKDNDCDCAGDSNGDGVFCGPGDDGVDETIPDSGDSDGDGFRRASCGGSDCNDSDPNTFPGATELCNGADEDCNSVTDDRDQDQDGHRDADCGGDDCDDSDASIHPLAVERCNGIDDNCTCTVDSNGDGVFCGPGDDGVDEGFNNDGDIAFNPADGLSWWSIDGSIVECQLLSMVGNFVGVLDCDDSNPQIHPGQSEICNTIDDNCDGLVDEGFFPDADGDGHRSEACGGDDCDERTTDLNNDGIPDGALIFPGAQEFCDGLDGDCDGEVDEDFDFDVDGYIDGANPECAQSHPLASLDCDDQDPSVHPNARELCVGGVDEDCDGDIDQEDADCAGGSPLLPQGFACAYGSEGSIPWWLLLSLVAISARRRSKKLGAPLAP